MLRHSRSSYDEPVVVTGIGLNSSLGLDRESTWGAIQSGASGVDWLRDMPWLPDGVMIGAQVKLPHERSGRLKASILSEKAADEAIADSRLDLARIDRDRVACAIAGHMGDCSGIQEMFGGGAPSSDRTVPWWTQIMPNLACWHVASKYQLMGPRLCHSTACASGLISFLSAVRAIRDQQCDIAVAGGGEAINPLFAAGFQNMRALAHHPNPQQACRPFDRHRNGFVMGEGAAIFVLERLSHALARNARIYCTVSSGKILSEAHHMTGLDVDCEALDYLISSSLKQAHLTPEQIGYVNAHGTGTEQNDLAEMRAISSAFGRHLDQLCVSATKSMIGHLVNAAGCVELAVTILGMRDGFAPPTLNLTHPDPLCRFDCLPWVGRNHRFQHALKLSLAFGGHLVGVVASRWNDAQTGFAYPAPLRRAA